MKIYENEVIGQAEYPTPQQEILDFYGNQAVDQKSMSSFISLDNISDGILYSKVLNIGILKGKLVIAGLDSVVTARMFTDGDAKTNIEAWRHASDVTLIDGGDIYTGSITALGIVTAGAFVCSTVGYLRGGQIAYNTGVGFWLGYDTDKYKFSIGDSAGDKMTWDGSNLKISGTISNTRSIEAGEDMDPGVTVYISLGGLDATIVEFNATGAVQADIFGIRWAGQTFQTNIECSVTKVNLRLKKYNVPVGNVQVDLYEVNGNDDPTGDSLGTVTVVGTSLGTTFALIEFAFASEIDLDANTTYIMVCKAVDTDGTNRIAWECANSGNPYAKGEWLYTLDSGENWSHESTYDFTFNVYAKLRADRVYRTNASFDDERIEEYVGFNTETVTAGNNAKITILGTHQTGLSGLTPDADYYLSDAPGEISTASGTNEVIVGKAISTTELLLYESILKDLKVAKTRFIVSVVLRNSNDTQRDTDSASWVKVKEIEINENLEGVRIKFDLAGSCTGNCAYGRVYKNGGAIGDIQGPVGASGAWYTFSQDFAGFFKGDLIQIYAYCDYGFTASIRNFRLYYNDEVYGFGDKALTTSLPINTVAISATNQDP